MPAARREHGREWAASGSQRPDDENFQPGGSYSNDTVTTTQTTIWHQQHRADPRRHAD